MKYCILAAALFAALFSCKKHDGAVFIPEKDPYRNLCPAGYDDHLIAGKWRKMVTYNGMTGQPQPEPANQYTVLELNTNNTYTTTVNGQVTQAGYYDTATITSQLSHTQKLVLFFDGNQIPMIMHTSHDSLSMGPDVFDGGGSLYRRDCR